MPQCDTLKIKRKNKICPEAPRLSALNAVTADAKRQESLNAIRPRSRYGSTTGT